MLLAEGRVVASEPGRRVDEAKVRTVFGVDATITTVDGYPHVLRTRETPDPGPGHR